MIAGWRVLESKTFVIPSLPPSKNKLHTIIRRSNHPLIFKRSSDYEKWLQESLPYISMLKPLVNSHYFGIKARFHYPFHHLNGKHKRMDCHNFLEALCDAVSTKNGFDDSYVKVTIAEAVDSQDEKIEVELTQLEAA